MRLSASRLERFSLDVNRNSHRGFPAARKSDSGCSDGNGGGGRWRRDTRRTSGAGGRACRGGREQTGGGAAARSRRLDGDPLDRALDDDGQRRGIARHRPQPLAAGGSIKQWLLDLVAAEPDLTLEEIRARLTSEKRLKAGTTSIWRFYERHDITFKKNSARRRTGSS